MTGDEALDKMSAILCAQFGSGTADLQAIAELVKQTGRPVGNRFTAPAVFLYTQP
jgi:hypothetical protein